MRKQETRLEKIRRLSQPENRPIVVLWGHMDGGHYTVNGETITKDEIQARYGDDILLIEVEYIDQVNP